MQEKKVKEAFEVAFEAGRAQGAAAGGGGADTVPELPTFPVLPPSTATAPAFSASANVEDGEEET